ncbi:MAG TPA: baseplate J/gp47 family protein [Gemmatimonadaceae bacterium]|nr:baseplate J/gp47 family protein [Gemmatimonadaceae bacterium]
MRGRIAPFTALVLALSVAAVGLAAYLFVPRMTVILRPATESLSGTVEIVADPAASAVDVARARIPARVGFVVVEVNEPGLVQGRAEVPDAHAEGTATFSNRMGGVATIPAGTVVTTPSGARFATRTEAAIEAAAGSTVRVPIRALEPGEAGNVARLAINRIVGPLATQLAVLNEETTVGGGQGNTPVVSAADHARVRSLAAERARSEALARLRAEAREDETLVLQTLDRAVLEEELDREVGEAATSFRYRLRARFTAARIGDGDVRQVVRETWRPTVPDGFFLPEEQLQVWPPEVVRVDGGAVILRVPVRSVAARWIDPHWVREQVQWREADVARRALARALPFAAEPRVILEPRWASRAYRVEVVVDLSTVASGGG